MRLYAVFFGSGTLGFSMFAQAIETPTTIVGAFALVFVAFASLIGWIVKRLFDKTIPEQQATFSAQLDKERAFFKESMNEVLLAFRTAHSDLVTRLELLTNAIHNRLNDGGGK